MKSIFIVGATSTGKTDLSSYLAKVVSRLPGVTGVDIISADSKQVFIGQDIVTGKDRDKLRLESGIKLHGIDLVNPDAEWSVAHFVKYASSLGRAAELANRVVIVVGGTGMYLSSLLTIPESISVLPNTALRLKLERYSVAELQTELRQLDEVRFISMNESDNQNPRRLVRAIEVAKAKQEKQQDLVFDSCFRDPFIVNLTCELVVLEQRIRSRVLERLAVGAIEETQKLRAIYGERWSKEAYAAIGYREIEEFLSGKIDREALIDLWTLHEVQYAKRQELWFKNMEQVSTFSILESQLKENIVKQLENWYTQSNETAINS